MREFGVLDELYLRTEIQRVRQLGYAGQNTGLLEGMAGLAVPIVDRKGRDATLRRPSNSLARSDAGTGV